MLAPPVTVGQSRPAFAVLLPDWTATTPAGPARRARGDGTHTNLTVIGTSSIDLILPQVVRADVGREDCACAVGVKDSRGDVFDDPDHRDRRIGNERRQRSGDCVADHDALSSPFVADGLGNDAPIYMVSSRPTNTELG